MSTLYITHPACLDHQTPLGHPERPDRLRAIEAVLEDERFQTLAREQAPAASDDLLTLCHPADLVNELREATPREGILHIDADTAMSSGSFEAALRAAGGAVLAVDEVLTGKAHNAFVAVRPPGHHAETVRPMGFCLFNNAAIAARHAQRKHGIGRVAIVDFDVHHGNGTQHFFEDRADVLYVSTHQYPFYPGTGAADERGRGAGEGTTVNIPLPAGSGDGDYREAFERQVLPATGEFAPDVLLVSAGFDSWQSDPVGGMRVSRQAFRQWGVWLRGVAEDHCRGRILLVLEGGYDIEALADLAIAHLDGLAG